MNYLKIIFSRRKIFCLSVFVTLWCCDSPDDKSSTVVKSVLTQTNKPTQNILPPGMPEDTSIVVTVNTKRELAPLSKTEPPLEFELRGKIKSMTLRQFVPQISEGKIIKTEEFLEPWIYDLDVQFNKNGRMTKLVQYSQKKPYSFWQSIFDKAGNIVMIVKKNSSDSSVSGKVIYTLDKKGNVLVKTETNAKALRILKNVYDHDKKGSLVKETRYYSWNNEISAIYNFEYNNHGNRINENMTAVKTGIVFPADLKYNAQNMLVCRYEKSNSSFNARRISYNYNKEGDLVNEISTIEDGKNETTEKSRIYVYDDHGNWVRKTEFKDKLPVLISERIIEYY